MAIQVLTYDPASGRFFSQLIGAAQLAQAAVTSGKLGALAINSPDINWGAILSGHIGASVLATPHLQPQGILSASIGTLAIGTPHINWGAITSGKLASGFPLNNLLFETQSFVNLLVNGDFEIGDPPVGWEEVAQTWERSSTQKKTGSFSIKGTRAAPGNAYRKQTILDVVRYRGRKITFGCWVFATTAGQTRLEIVDSVGGAQTSYHSGGGSWEWLTVSYVVDVAATSLEVWLCIYTTNGDAYFDGAMLVEGDTCPAFSPMPVDIQSVTSGKVAPSSILSGNIAPLSIGDLHIISGLDAGKVTLGTLVDARLPTILGGKIFSGRLDSLVALAGQYALHISGAGGLYAVPQYARNRLDANIDKDGNRILSGRSAWQLRFEPYSDFVDVLRMPPGPAASSDPLGIVFRIYSGFITQVGQFDGVDISEHTHLGATGDAPKILSGGIGSGQIGAPHIAGSDRSCRVKNSVNQSAINNDWTTLAFDSEDWDTDNIHDTVTSSSILTCRTPGKHLVIADVVWGTVASPSGGRTVELFLNELRTYCGQDTGAPLSGWTWQMMATSIFDLAVNDRIEVRVYHNQGAAVDVNAATRFQMIKIL